MAEYHRPPRADVIDVAVAVGVGDVSTRRLADEQRRAADRAKRADGAVDAAGNHLLGALKRSSDLVVSSFVICSSC